MLRGGINHNVTLSERSEAEAYAAFCRVYDQWYGPLFHLLLRLTGSEDHAKDILHDVFLRLWERRDEIAAMDGVKSYLFASVRNAAADLFRKRKAERNYIAGMAGGSPGSSGSPGSPDSPDSPEQQAALHEMELIAAYAVSRMPEKRRRVFELSYRDGLSPAQIATQLGISPRSVSDHLYEARGSIQKLLPLT